MDAYVHADSADKIYNVGIGGVGSNSAAFDIANSTTVNKLNNDVKASILNSTVKAYNSVGVVANSNDVLTNIAGGMSVGWKSLIGVGLSVGVNDISGDTIASISGSTIEAQGAGGKTYKDHEFTTDAEKNKMSISEKEHKGLVVDAYSKHDITNVSVTAGAMFGEDGDLVLTGVGNSNKLNGKTEYFKTEDFPTFAVLYKRVLLTEGVEEIQVGSLCNPTRKGEFYLRNLSRKDMAILEEVKNLKLIDGAK